MLLVCDDLLFLDPLLEVSDLLKLLLLVSDLLLQLSLETADHGVCLG